MNISINNYALKHHDSVTNIFKQYPDIFPKWEIKLLSADLKKPSQSNQGFIAQDGEEVVGFISLRKFDDTQKGWSIGWLAVVPSHAKHKIATKLINHLLSVAKQQKLKRIFIETCTCVDQQPARITYEKAGFRQCGLLKEYYDKGHSKTIYEKEI